MAFSGPPGCSQGQYIRVTSRARRPRPNLDERARDRHAVLLEDAKPKLDRLPDRGPPGLAIAGDLAHRLSGLGAPIEQHRHG
ncbi:MAG: hypothetical protein RML56_00965 [Burkholderiales bacterium]|nr:hypothetical protein [Burkholderiales bacterium]